jgi:hypothetical protein
MKRCATCKFWTVDEGLNLRLRGDFRTCARIHEHAPGYGLMDSTTAPTVLIEDDEGWGIYTGPTFGCVLHESRTP